MTNGNISPLRRRMTEDMTVRGFTARTQARIHPRGRGFHGLFRPFSEPGERGGPAALSAAHEIQRGLGDHHERGTMRTRV